MKRPHQVSVTGHFDQAVVVTSPLLPESDLEELNFQRAISRVIGISRPKRSRPRYEVRVELRQMRSKLARLRTIDGAADAERDPQTY